VALIAGGAIVVLVTATVLSYLAFMRLDASLKSGNTPTASAVPCDLLEHTQVHYHAALQILDGGTPVEIPTDLGRSSACFYWLHLHTGEPGVIHVEAPDDRTFTLGDFFGVWSMWSGQKELIDRTHVSTIALRGGQKLAVYVDTGDGPQEYSGDAAPAGPNRAGERRPRPSDRDALGGRQRHRLSPSAGAVRRAPSRR